MSQTTYLIPQGWSYVGELDVFETLTIEKGQSVRAQSLGEGIGPAPWDPIHQFIYESIDFDVSVLNISGSMLEINFTRDDTVLRTELVQSSVRIVLSGYGEYRVRPSNVDVTLRAIDKEVRVKVLIDIHRRTRIYNPILFMIIFMGFNGVIILEIGSKILSYKKKT